MIASQEEKVLRIFDFVSEQKTDGLEGELSSINIISQE